MTRWNFTSRNCPQCGSHDASRSKRRGFFEQSILEHSPWRAYRCNWCGRRYYGRSLHPDASSDRSVGAHVSH